MSDLTPGGSLPDPAREARRRLGLDLTDVQREAVAAVLDGADTLLISPTGSGKSAVYQLAGALTEGVTIIVSPLLALQEDQLKAFADLDLGPAVAISSLRGQAARTAALGRIDAGAVEFVLLAPEQLQRSDVQTVLRRSAIDRIVVDEAHCVDLWGADLRPDYAALGAVRASLGSPPVLATTATAPPHVRAEIVDVLRMTDPVQVIAPTERANIDPAVVRHASRADLDAAVVDEVRDLEGRGLVYVGRRQDAEEVAARLDGPGRRALAYHGSLPAARRREVHEAFGADDEVVVVATNAFGLGIDASDVRFVVHTDAPETIDSYAQEIGRAGRDGQRATATLHVVAGSAGRRRFAAGRSLPDEALCAAVAALSRPAPLDEVRRALGQSRGRLLQAVRLVERSGGVALAPDLVVQPGPAPWADIRDRVAAELDAAAALRRTRREMIDAYVDSDDCRWSVLTGYLGGAEVDACGHCDVCQAAGRRRAEATSRDEGAVAHPEFGTGSVVREDDDVIVVLFDRAGYRTLSKEVLADPAAGARLQPAPRRTAATVDG
jgi:ATP-dependent DNA helicase RecQ